MGVAEILDKLDELQIPYVVRDGKLCRRRGVVLDADLAAEFDAQRAALATEATRFYAERGLPIFTCHHCGGIVRPDTGRVVHPPDWPETRRTEAPLMHTWCFAEQSWWRLDVDDPLAQFADLIAESQRGAVPEEGSVTLDSCTTITNPRTSVLSAARHIESGSCLWRTSQQRAAEYARLVAVDAWWRAQQQRAEE